MRIVFLDSVGLIASWNDRDQWHAAAVAAREEFLSGGSRIVSIEAVLFETANALARSPHRQGVAMLKRRLAESGDLILPTEMEMDKAWSAYSAGHASAAGIVDQISFQIMSRLGITEAFTNDQHFKAAGFTTLF